VKIDDAWQALVALRLSESTAEVEQARQDAPNGRKRLAHLVPELAPTQRELARLLAAAAWRDCQRRDAAAAPDDATWKAFRERTPETLAEQAERGATRPQKARAWRACQLWLDPENRARFVGDPPNRRKVVDPIPAAIEALVRRHFCGQVQRPDYTADDVSQAHARFVLRCALEADLSATGTAGAHEIVAEITGKTPRAVQHIWEGRAEHTKRQTQT
jgi:hypothetical protein